MVWLYLETQKKRKVWEKYTAEIVDTQYYDPPTQVRIKFDVVRIRCVWLNRYLLFFFIHLCFENRTEVSIIR